MTTISSKKSSNRSDKIHGQELQEILSSETIPGTVMTVDLDDLTDSSQAQLRIQDEENKMQILGERFMICRQNGMAWNLRRTWNRT